VGRVGSDRPRGYHSEIGLRLDPHECFFPRDDNPKTPARYRLPRPRFRQCHGFTRGELEAIAAFPEVSYHYGCRDAHPRLDGPMGPHYRGRLVQPLSDMPDPMDDLTLDLEDDVGDPHEPCATTSIWPEKPPRTRSGPGRPGTPAWPRLPGPPVRCPGGEPEAYAILAEALQVESTGRNFAGQRVGTAEEASRVVQLFPRPSGGSAASEVHPIMRGADNPPRTWTWPAA
jgi:hypothetical protein